MTHWPLAFGTAHRTFTFAPTTTMKPPRTTRKPLSLVGESTNWNPFRRFLKDALDVPYGKALSVTFDLLDEHLDIEHKVWVTRLPDTLTYNVYVVQKVYAGGWRGLLFEAYLKGLKGVSLAVQWHHQYEGEPSAKYTKAVKQVASDVSYIWEELAIAEKRKGGAQ